MQTIHIHLGPHKTGSTSIQTFLRCSRNALSQENIHVVSPKVVTRGGRLIATGRREEALTLLRDVEVEARESGMPDIVISSEDFCGVLPGRGPQNRVYPQLSKNIEFIRSALPGMSHKFYFFVRQPETWIHSVYFQNIKYGRKFSSLESFRDLMKLDDLWDGVLEKSRTKAGSILNEIDFLEGEEFDAVAALFSRMLGTRSEQIPFPARERSNVSSSSNAISQLELLNSAKGSDYAVSQAKANVVRRSSNSVEVADLPKSDSFEAQMREWRDGLSGLEARSARRMVPQKTNWVLPEIAFPLDSLWHDIVPLEDLDFKLVSRTSMEGQARILRFRFRGMPFPCYILGMLISYLRRDTEFTQKASDLYQLMWKFETINLLAFLPTRWLISSFQTFLDRGENENQRLVGGSAYFFANMLKAYEGERALNGLDADGIYPNIVPMGKSGGFGLDQFDLGQTDLLVNTISLLYEVSLKDELSGPVVREFIRRLKAGASIFSRMDQSRLHHKVESQGFENCWSFFESPVKVSKENPKP